MQLNFVTEISWVILVGLIVAMPCEASTRKALTGINIYSDTIPKNILLDTSLQFDSFISLNKYGHQAQQRLKSYSVEIQNKNSDPEEVRYLLDSLNSLNNDMLSYLLYKYLKSSAKSLNALITFSNFITPSKIVTVTDQKELFEMYPESIKNSAEGKKLFLKINSFSVPSEGEIDDFILSNTILKTLKGETISAKAVFTRRKYEYYLIIFGASWCAPCRRENIFLKRHLNNMDTAKVKIIGLSIDNDALAWKKSVMQDDCNWENFLLKSGQESLLYKKNITKKIPFNLLINFKEKITQGHYDIRVVLESLPLTIYSRSN